MISTTTSSRYSLVSVVDQPLSAPSECVLKYAASAVDKSSLDSCVGSYGYRNAPDSVSEMRAFFSAERLCNVTVASKLDNNLKYIIRVRKDRSKHSLASFWAVRMRVAIALISRIVRAPPTCIDVAIAMVQFICHQADNCYPGAKP